MGEVMWQVVVPRSLHEEVLRAAHGDVGSGHFGVTKTLHRRRQGFYWGQHKRDVEDSHMPSSSSALWGSPWRGFGVDVVGPLPCTERGNEYVLTAMDYFTKWPEAYALPDQEAENIADALLGGMISRFGAAESIHRDQGSVCSFV